MTSYKNFMAGEFVAGSAGEFTNYNPADTREAVASYGNAGETDARLAVTAAQAAYPVLAAQTPIARGRILNKASQSIEAKKKRSWRNY
jgi:acyl-CoA reductase-like NAD-dependent aldehyde dehydrogenase